ncbi:MAG: permease-like cell division protein FtsX [Aquimonas sp.]|nr:permease-like cell division protein FtsX [Aquimonas sp.]
MSRNRRRRPAASPRPAPGSARLGGRLQNWLQLHLFSLVSSLGRLWTRPFASGLTVGVMAIALALPLALGLLIGNLQKLSGAVEQSREIGVFLAVELEPEAIEVSLQAARDLSGVAEVGVRSPEQGLDEFRALAGFAEALALLESNPIPAVLEVVPEVGADPAALVAALQTLPGVELVQHDALWRQRLDGWLALGQRFAQALTVLLVLGALLVVGNTVRLDVQGRAEEIAVIHLLGGTAGFVRRPFLYLGVWYGLGAGMLALAVLAALVAGLSVPAAELAESYGSGFRLHGFSILDGSAVLAGAAGLGWLGAYLAVGHHLRQVESGRRVDEH